MFSPPPRHLSSTSFRHVSGRRQAYQHDSRLRSVTFTSGKSFSAKLVSHQPLRRSTRPLVTEHRQECNRKWKEKEGVAAALSRKGWYSGTDESKSVAEVTWSGIIFLALREVSRGQVGHGGPRTSYALSK